MVDISLILAQKIRPGTNDVAPFREFVVNDQEVILSCRLVKTQIRLPGRPTPFVQGVSAPKHAGGASARRCQKRQEKSEAEKNFNFHSAGKKNKQTGDAVKNYCRAFSRVTFANAGDKMRSAN